MAADEARWHQAADETQPIGRLVDLSTLVVAIDGPSVVATGLLPAGLLGPLVAVTWTQVRCTER